MKNGLNDRDTTQWFGFLIKVYFASVIRKRHRQVWGAEYFNIHLDRGKGAPQDADTREWRKRKEHLWYLAFMENFNISKEAGYQKHGVCAEALLDNLCI